MPTSRLSDAEFRDALTALVPHLRAFARSLCGGDTHLADDMAQDALMRAWARRDKFEPGTNMRAWTFTILRNGFYSDRRRAWRQESLDPAVAERELLAKDDPSQVLELEDLRRALGELVEEQREALILTGAGGFSYEEAASICGTPIGTIKSRVNRARAHLLRVLDSGILTTKPDSAGAAMDRLIDELEQRAGGALAIAEA